MTSFDLRPIGRVESPLTDLESAPRQADEGAPGAWLVFEPEMLEALRSLRAGDDMIVLTWLDRARRDVLRVHPRAPRRKSPPSTGGGCKVRHLEALDGTPILDVKPVLHGDISRR